MGQSMRLTLNNDLIDKILSQLEEMKVNHNRLVKLASPDGDSVLVIEHSKRDKVKPKKEKKSG